MSGAPKIRTATLDDAAAIAEIYNWYVAETVITFETEAPDEAEMARRFDTILGKGHPLLIGEIAGQVVGYAYASTYRERAAYRFTCEDSVYVHHDHHGRGIGSALLADLIGRARALDYHTIVAGADAEQTVSIALHRRFGFEPVAHLKQVGYKFERWLDVVFLQLML